jgi:hypothetical protein
MQLAQTMRVTSKSHTIPFEIMYDITKVCVARLYLSHIDAESKSNFCTSFSSVLFLLIADIIHSFLPPSERETKENLVLSRWSL